jgi:hypothetical protein
VTDSHEEARSVATAQLRSGESLYWAGRSDPSVVFTPADGFLIPFSIVWCGFAVFWEVAAATEGAPVPMVAFGAVFVLVGLYIVAGRFILKRHRKRTTTYAITDRRAVVITGRTSRETPIGRTDRTLHWSRDRSHCTVRWNDDGRNGLGFFFGPGLASRMYANTGLDLFGTQTVAFWDVADTVEMVRSLERASTV